MRKYSIVHSVRVCTEFTPETYGRLKTIGPAFMLPVGRHKRSAPYQVCVCACGQHKAMAVNSLRSRKSTSCGCLHAEILSKRSFKHGRTRTPEYTSWQLMRDRCSNPNNFQYSDYGGRGITYCERWKKFENFFADMGKKPSPEHTLDRFPDQNGNYEPSNCRWATWREQNNNRRDNRMINIAGIVDTLPNWCRIYAANYSTVKSRINNGCDPLLALTMPRRQNQYR